jgi:hypothetical protein
VSGFDDLKPLIRPEFRELAERGNITVEEYEKIRCNSYERDLLIPALTDEAFEKEVQRTLDNCTPPRGSPVSTYDEAMIGLYGPELLKRFRNILNSFRELEEAITVDRAATDRVSYAWEVLQTIRSRT